MSCTTKFYCFYFVDKYNLASASPVTNCISLIRCSLLFTPRSSCSIFSSNMQNMLPLIFSSLKAFLYFFKCIASNNCRTLTKMINNKEKNYLQAPCILHTHVAHVHIIEIISAHYHAKVKYPTLQAYLLVF